VTPRIAAGPRRAAVVGHPISHSLSPLLHTTAYRALGLTDWAYEAHDVRPGELSTFLAGCGDEWVGLSVTMPHKVDAALLAAARAPSVERTGVANTLLRSPRGWQAHNTDIEGIVGSLRGVARVAPTTVTVLGTGATARSACAAAVDLRSAVLTVVGRNPAAGAQCLSVITGTGVSGHLVDLGDAQGCARALTANVVIATVPPGAADSIIDRVPAVGAGLLLDVAYRPWPTPLASAWQQAGGQVVAGVDMLVHQACAQILLMTGRPVAVDSLLDVARGAAH